MTIMEVRSLIGLQSRCQQGSFLLELLDGNPFFSFSSFWKPLAFFNLCVCVCVCVCSVAQSRPIFSDPMECSLPGSFCPWNFSGKNIGVGCHFLLYGIFLTQGSNLCLSLTGGFFTLLPPGKPVL